MITNRRDDNNPSWWQQTIVMITNRRDDNEPSCSSHVVFSRVTEPFLTPRWDFPPPACKRTPVTSVRFNCRAILFTYVHGATVATFYCNDDCYRTYCERLLLPRRCRSNGVISTLNNDIIIPRDPYKILHSLSPSRLGPRVFYDFTNHCYSHLLTNNCRYNYSEV